MLNNILLIALGSALGGVLRFLNYEFFNFLAKNNSLISNKFPFATLSVNVIGSLLAGILYFFIIKNFENFSPLLKNFLMIGFLGGFTTFSAFSLDFFRLIQANQISYAIIYAISSVFISLIAVFLGFYLMKFFS
ncbi:putative fluoride ion transporter CrcB [Alphaproteobacteria bacterium]|nr:putative fluoride ion transporter CrcB [Alphaproteobacteria bacterium]